MNLKPVESLWIFNIDFMHSFIETQRFKKREKKNLNWLFWLMLLKTISLTFGSLAAACRWSRTSVCWVPRTPNDQTAPSNPLQSEDQLWVKDPGDTKQQEKSSKFCFLLNKIKLRRTANNFLKLELKETQSSVKVPEWVCVRSTKISHLSDLQVGFSIQIRGLNVAHGLRLAAERKQMMHLIANYLDFSDNSCIVNFLL